MAAEAYLLDVTRLLSRLGRGALTGIDRVELAYLGGLLASGLPVFALAKTPAGVLLLPKEAMRQIEAWSQGSALPIGSDLIGRLGRKDQPVLAAIEAKLRRMAIARAPIFLAGRMLRRTLPANTRYLNVGHANLSSRMLRAIREKAGFQIAVLLHDTIPLDHPEYTRADQVETFRRKVAAISAHADVVIHSAQATRETNELQLKKFGRVPAGIVSPLGVSIPDPDNAELPDGIDLARGYFVTVGTIEPRKNHQLLLDVWESIAHKYGPMPHLYIVGNRGWAEASLLDRLDQGVAGVSVLNGLSDSGVAALVSHADALLFPSLAEGFGLPALEARALGTQVICTDLPIFRELLGIEAVYLPPGDIYSWERTIMDRFLHGRYGRNTVNLGDIPTWSNHLRIVLTRF